MTDAVSDDVVDVDHVNAPDAAPQARQKPKKKRLLTHLVRWGLVGILLLGFSPFMLRGLLALRFSPRTHTVEAAPEGRRIAIVFGARVYPSGRPSAMLADRIATGVDLYHAGKVDLILMTGDGREDSYNEPGAMARYAMSLGVPPEDIVQDRAGTRTYDSCYRARQIYGVEEAILVTQNFHLDRALFLCNTLGVFSDGVAADYQRPWGYSRFSLSWSRIREIPATTVALWDLIVREPPSILGEPTPIFLD